MKNFLLLFVIVTFIFTSCVSIPSAGTQEEPRKLILDGKIISEDEVGGFICWYCTNYSDEDEILVEAG